MRRSSQDLWTQGEALERAGNSKEAIDCFVRAAASEEDSGRPVRAKLLWEQIAVRAGVSGNVLERIAAVCTRGKLFDDAFDYWTAAAARFHLEGRGEEAERSRAHAAELKKRLAISTADATRVMPDLARQAIAEAPDFVRDLVG
jgi:hypothetical protein